MVISLPAIITHACAPGQELSTKPERDGKVSTCCAARPYRNTPHMWRPAAGSSCRLPAPWPVPCPAPGPERTARGTGKGRQGERAKAGWGESRLSPAQPAKWGFRELIRAMVKLGLPSHHIARTQAQVSFGHVRRGMLDHTTSYYRCKRGALCKVDHLYLLPISNVTALMSG